MDYVAGLFGIKLIVAEVCVNLKVAADSHIMVLCIGPDSCAFKLAHVVPLVSGVAHI